jgi:hypothetical protein
VTVITPGDNTKLPGRHIWLRLPDGVSLGSTAGRLGERLDTRSDGGYCLAPPSVGPLGRRYQWHCDCAGTVAAAPQWLLELLATPNGATPPTDWQKLAKGVAEGARNSSLTKLTGYLLRRRVEPFVARELIHSFNATHCTPPLPAHDVDRIVASIAGRELRRRESANE